MERKEKSVKKVLPFSREAEKSLLGILLLQESAWDKVELQLLATDFYDIKNQNIFRAIEQMHVKQQSVDILTVVEYLQNQQVIEQSGSDTYIYGLQRRLLLRASTKLLLLLVQSIL